MFLNNKKLQIVIVLIAGILSLSCTIFYIYNDGVILAGNNEDWKDPYTKMWFFEQSENNHGWIKFGFGSGFPQGGMNEYGLFWDGTAGPFLEMPYSEANKEKYQGPIMQKVMEECGGIAEALEVFDSYYCEDQYKAQYLIGDSSGISVIVEGDNKIRNDKGYQVLTNFYQSNPDLGGYPCWRYQKATEMLDIIDSLTTYQVGSILASTHQEGKYPTQYSNIYDIINRLIFLFYYHNYEEYVTIDLQEELRKGNRSYDIPGLFSYIKIISPINYETIESSTLTFQWSGISGNSYEIVYSTEPDFSSYESTGSLSDITHPGNLFGKDLLLFGFPIIVLFCIRRKRSKVIKLFMVSLLVIFLFRCAKEEEPSWLPETVKFTKTISNLSPNTTYYWKIVAHPESTDDFFSETVIMEFTTGN